MCTHMSTRILLPCLRSRQTYIHMSARVPMHMSTHTRLHTCLYTCRAHMSTIMSTPVHRFVYNARGHRSLRLMRVSASSGAVSVMIAEESATFVDYSSKFFLHRRVFGHVCRHVFETWTCFSRLVLVPWVCSQAACVWTCV